MVEVLIDIFESDNRLVKAFFQKNYDEDQWAYLFVLLLECPDYVTRVNISNLVKYVLNILKEEEKDYLYEMEVVEQKNEDGSVASREERHKALSARFIIKAFEILNT